MQAEAGVVIQAVDDPGILSIGERDLSGVDLPEVVERLALEALVRPWLARWLRGDEVVAAQRLVHRRDRRRLDPGSAKLGPDPALFWLVGAGAIVLVGLLWRLFR